MKLPEQIKKYRKQSGLSQEELANKIYVSRQTISNWENNRSYPDVENLLLLSSLFNVSLDNLIRGDIDIMKRELNKYDMSLWTKVMLIFLFLGFVLGIPATYLVGTWGLVFALILLGIGILASLKIERLKKKYNLKTYQEIIAFNQNRELSLQDRSEYRQKYKKQQLFLIVISILISLALAFIMIFIMHLILK